MTRLAASFLVALLALPCAATARPADRIAAIVDGDVITFSEVEERAAQLKGRFPDQKKKSLQEDALEDLIADRLFGRQVKDLNIEIGEPEIKLAIDDVLKQNHFESESQLEDALQGQGLSFDEYKENLRHQLAQMKLVNLKVRSRVKIGDEEVKRRYEELTLANQGEEEISAAHILVKLAPDAPPAEVQAAKEKAQKIVVRARAGEDFTALAKELSEGPSKDEGGDLGWFRRGEMTRELEQAAFSMKDHQVSEPVRTRFGFHVVKVTGRRAVAQKPLEEMQDEIRDRLYREEMDHQTQRYLDELKKDAVIDYKIPELKKSPVAAAAPAPAARGK